MARSDLVHHPMVTGAGPQKNHWYNYPDYQMERAQREVNRAASAVLDGARKLDLAPRRPSRWQRFMRRLRGERTIEQSCRDYIRRHRFGLEQEYGIRAERTARQAARQLFDQIFTGVTDYRPRQPSGGRPRRDIPAWALFCYPTAAGLAVGALLYLLRP